MTQMESILSESLKIANQTIKQQAMEITALRKTVDELRAELSSRDTKIDSIQASLSSLEEAITISHADLRKEQRKNKGMSKILANTSEKQKEQVSQEEPKESTYDPKARGNNNAKRNTHPEMEVEVVELEPDLTDWQEGDAKELAVREVVRYIYIPGKFIKRIYRQHCYKHGDEYRRAAMPLAPLQNSNYDGSFIAGVAELRYMYSMPVERIVSYFQNHGFNVDKSTVNGLLQKTALLLENVYKSLRQTVLDDPYKSADETYMKVLIQEMLASGKHIRKGYMWDMIGKTIGLMYYYYQEGSRSEDVFLNEIKGVCGVIQSDGFAPYRKVGGEDYPNIIRLACLQHIKRKFIDAKGEADADKMVNLINQLYRQEHQHRIGEDGWTEADNLRWRRHYAPPILKEIKQEVKRILARPDLDPQGELYGAATYLQNEMRDVENIFRGGRYDLDNNEVERYNRYISLSRRNSLFFGSHKGAKNGAILYSLACSCKMQGVRFFDYITDILNHNLAIPHNAKPDAYRQLLPDRWKQNHPESLKK